jgi:hypothetical protein
VSCDQRAQKEGDVCINRNAERIGREDEPILNFSMTSHPQYRLLNSHGRGLMSSCWCLSPGVADATDA